MPPHLWLVPFLAAAMWLGPGCVDLKEPWKKGSGGAGGSKLDAPGATGGASSTGGFAIDGGGARGGQTGLDAGGDVTGAGGRSDAALGGAGGAMDAGAGGSGGGVDVAVGETGGNPDVPLGGSGGAGTGGVATGGTTGALDAGAGGTGGVAAGGTTGNRDASQGGTGGSTSADAPGADLGPDVADVGPDSSPPSGPIVYYTCESVSGTKLPDQSGNKNDGTLLSGPLPDGGTPTAGYAVEAGKFGNGLRLIAAGRGYVSIPITALKDLGDVTIATWIKVTTSSAALERIFDLGIDAKLAQNQPTGTVYMTFLLSDPFNSGINSFSSTKDGYTNAKKLSAAANALPANTWKHVALTLGAGNATLYVDGASVSTQTSVLAPKDLGAIDYAFIGHSQFTDDPYLDAQIDEFRVYNRALSAAEVKLLFDYVVP